MPIPNDEQFIVLLYTFIGTCIGLSAAVLFEFTRWRSVFLVLLLWPLALIVTILYIFIGDTLVLIERYTHYRPLCKIRQLVRIALLYWVLRWGECMRRD